jgi:energy-coupling factor transporter ATP-binding protein EcfA2
MPKQSYGKINQQRSQILLLALLSFANDELEAEDRELERLRSQIQTHWQTEKKLVVRTKTRYLESLIKLMGQEVLSIDHIKTALKHLENHVGILDDHRTAQRGSDNWHFTINLWFDRWQQTANIEAFDRAWSGNSERQSADQSERSHASGSPENASESQLDWPHLCRQALDTSLSSNPLMTNIGKAFDLNDLYLPLGVEERRFIRGDDENALQYQPTELIAKLLAANETNRIAIIGTPGAGKTTLLQKIAQSLSETSGCLPTWISLAELGGQSLENYLTQNWLKDALRLFQVSPQQQQELVEQVNDGRVWLLLDAIDEMGASSGALTYLAKQFKGWLSQAHVVLTCRSNLWDGEKNALMDFETYQILSFKHTQDGVPAFIQRWFQESPESGQKLALRLTQKSMERIHSCVTNPLYLALLCRSWMLNQGQLPSTKTSLYRQFVEAIYSWKQDLFPTTLSQRQSLNQILAALAVQAMQQRDSIFRIPSTLVLAAFAADLDLLTLALNLGLLKQSGHSIASGDPIYGFHHPTFQEYFAAQAIADRQQFFAFNIFDLKWREVLPLWLGREDIADRAKEELLQSLLNFEDTCGSFYCYRAYFLAGEGVAEFPAFSAGDKIVAKLVELRYLGSFNPTVPTTITERAGIALSKTDRRRAIRALENFIQIPTPENFQATWLAAHSLGRNYDAGNTRAVATLETLLVNALDNYSKFSVAKSLIGIVPEHALAIDTLVQIVKSFEYPALQRRAARRLQMIGVDNPLVAGILAELRIEPQLAEIFSSIKNAPKNPSSQRDRQSKENLGDPRKIIESIVRKLQSNNSVNTKIRLANHLAKYEPDHPLVLESLLYCLKHCDQKAYLKQVGESLRSLVPIADLPSVLPKVRDIYLESPKKNPEQYHESYRILWYWSRSIGHPEFESLWNLGLEL